MTHSSVKRGGHLLVVDSGIGGMVYARAVHSLSPDTPIIYGADRAGFPYGEREPVDVRERVAELVSAVHQRAQLAGILIACNTASVVALDRIRRMLPALPVVGVVPAVKPAAELSRQGRIFVIATRTTVSDPYTDDLVERFARTRQVERIGAGGVVEAVERTSCAAASERPEDNREVRTAIEEVVGPLHCVPGDVLVLACTHFVAYRDQFASVAGPGVHVVDSLDGVRRRVVALMQLERSAAPGEARPDWKPQTLVYTGTPLAPSERRCGYAQFAEQIRIELPMDARRLSERFS